MGNNREGMKISWHPGFYGAMELELRSNRELLEFQREYPLSKEPLRMDLLIIRKTSRDSVQNEIGHIFKKYNIIEYKSPEDALSIDDYYKTIGYACLYKGLGDKVDQIPAEEMTVSLFRDRYPKELFQGLRKAGFIVDMRFPGIYYIHGSIPFDTQIVVTSRLEERKHSSLRLLSFHVKEEDVSTFLKETAGLKEPGDWNNREAILEVSIAANRKLYEEMRRKTMASNALRELFKEEIEAEKEKARQEGRQEGRREGRQEGRREGRQEGRLEGRQEERRERKKEERERWLSVIKILMVNMKWTADQAMEALNIPMEKREGYREGL